MQKIKNSKSLLSKYLTVDLYEKLKNLKTKNWCNLDELIKSNLENPDSWIWIYAWDSDSYKVFSEIFNPIIEDYHNLNWKLSDDNFKHVFDFDTRKLNFEIPENFDKYIVSTRIRTARNLDNFSFWLNLKNSERNKIEEIFANIFEKKFCKRFLLDGKFFNSVKKFFWINKKISWKYFSLKNFSEEEKNNLIKNHFLFKAWDRFLEAVWLNNDWPNWRWIFFNEDKSFSVRVNEEDELRIVSMQKWWDLKSVFRDLEFWVKKIEEELFKEKIVWKEGKLENIVFAKDEKLWYLASCPTNIWNWIRASVHIKLEKLWKNPDLLEKISDKYFLQIRWEHWEHTEHLENENMIFDISNKRRLWVSEVECVFDLYNWIKELIIIEEGL